jgi:hypothetical protein
MIKLWRCLEMQQATIIPDEGLEIPCCTDEGR